MVNKESEIGTSGYIEDYYNRGESSLWGDLLNFGSPVQEFSWKITKQNPGRAVPYLRTFIGVLELIASRNDSLYELKTRKVIKKLLDRNEEQIKGFRQLQTFTASDLRKLRTLVNDLSNIKTARLAIKIKKSN